MMKQIVLLQSLATTSSTLTDVMSGVDLEMAQQAPASGEWCMNDVLSHFIFVETHTLKRIKDLIDETVPLLDFIQPDENAHQNHKSPSDLIAQFDETRSTLLAYLPILSAEQWSAYGLFADGDATTVKELVLLLVNHDTQHLNQLVKIKERLTAL